jgi:hypothetical protein
MKGIVDTDLDVYDVYLLSSFEAIYLPSYFEAIYLASALSSRISIPFLFDNADNALRKEFPLPF